MIYFFQGVSKKDPDGIANGASHRAGVPLSRVNLRIWLKIRVFLVMVKFVSACVERDKKNFEKMDFCSYPLRELFEAKNSQF